MLNKITNIFLSIMAPQSADASATNAFEEGAPDDFHDVTFGDGDTEGVTDSDPFGSPSIPQVGPMCLCMCVCACIWMDGCTYVWMCMCVYICICDWVKQMRHLHWLRVMNTAFLLARASFVLANQCQGFTYFIP